MKPSYDFNVDNLSIGDWLTVSERRTPELAPVMDVIQRYTNIDVRSLPIWETDNLINAFMDAVVDELRTRVKESQS